MSAAAALLAASEPAALTPLEDLRRSRDAIRRASIGHARARRAVLFPLLAAAAAVLVAVFSGLGARDDEGAPATQTIAGGHRVEATPGARYSVATAGGDVRVALDAGEALFDVSPLADGHDFVVEAAGTRVTVTGTVFTVTRRADGVDVRVYEGSVRVDTPDGSRRLAAGDAYPEGAPTPRLDARARRLSAARLASREVTPVPDVVEPSPAPDPSDAREPPADVAPTAPGASRTATDLSPDGRSPRADAPAIPPPAIDDRGPLPPPRAPSLASARAALERGEYEDALAMSRAARRRSASAAWWSVEGDALRGLGRHEEAREAYARARTIGTSSQRVVAALHEARLLAGPLARPAEARRVLEQSGALEDGSPVASAARRLATSLPSR